MTITGSRRGTFLVAALASLVAVACAAGTREPAIESAAPSYVSDWGGFTLEFGADGSISGSIPHVESDPASQACVAADAQELEFSNARVVPSSEQGEPTYFAIVLPKDEDAGGVLAFVYFATPGDWSEIVIWPCDANQAGVHYTPVG